MNSIKTDTITEYNIEYFLNGNPHSLQLFAKHLIATLHYKEPDDKIVLIVDLNIIILSRDPKSEAKINMISSSPVSDSEIRLKQPEEFPEFCNGMDVLENGFNNHNSGIVNFKDAKSAGEWLGGVEWGQAMFDAYTASNNEKK